MVFNSLVAIDECLLVQYSLVISKNFEKYFVDSNNIRTFAASNDTIVTEVIIKQTTLGISRKVY